MTPSVARWYGSTWPEDSTQPSHKRGGTFFSASYPSAQCLSLDADADLQRINPADYCFANLSQCFSHLHNKDISGNILPMLPGRQQIYQELRKSASSPVSGEGSFLNVVRTQDSRGDNTFVGPLRNPACCQGDPLVPCVSCLLDATQR